MHTGEKRRPQFFVLHQTNPSFTLRTGRGQTIRCPAPQDCDGEAQLGGDSVPRSSQTRLTGDPATPGLRCATCPGPSPRWPGSCAGCPPATAWRGMTSRHHIPLGYATTKLHPIFYISEAFRVPGTRRWWSRPLWDWGLSSAGKTATRLAGPAESTQLPLLLESASASVTNPGANMAIFPESNAFGIFHVSPAAHLSLPLLQPSLLYHKAPGNCSSAPPSPCSILPCTCCLNC